MQPWGCWLTRTQHHNIHRQTEEDTAMTVVHRLSEHDLRFSSGMIERALSPT